MSRSETKVDTIGGYTMGYTDTEFSSGDSNRIKMKHHYQEENNNEINELSKELSEMGCIVDAVKKPSNVCVENCVHEDHSNSTDAEDVKSNTLYFNDNGDAYSDDEFEDDKSEMEDRSTKTARSARSEEAILNQNVKKSTSEHSLATNKAPMSVSGRSLGYGSLSIPPTRRVNMSFTNERQRDIERENHILLSKILSARNSRKSSIPCKDTPVRKQIPSAAVSRRQQQKRIDHENMILLKKIQRAKSSSCSIRR